MTIIKKTFKGNIYTIVQIDSKEDYDKALDNNVDIIQFTFLDREVGRFMHNVKPPKDYLYMSNRHIPYGDTAAYMSVPLLNNEVSLIFDNCFYKRNLHGKINDILYNLK